jgi:hypothetical protein
MVRIQDAKEKGTHGLTGIVEIYKSKNKVNSHAYFPVILSSNSN